MFQKEAQWAAFLPPLCQVWWEAELKSGPTIRRRSSLLDVDVEKDCETEKRVYDRMSEKGVTIVNPWLYVRTRRHEKTQ